MTNAQIQVKTGDTGKWNTTSGKVQPIDMTDFQSLDIKENVLLSATITVDNRKYVYRD